MAFWEKIPTTNFKHRTDFIESNKDFKFKKQNQYSIPSWFTYFVLVLLAKQHILTFTFICNTLDYLEEMFLDKSWNQVVLECQVPIHEVGIVPGELHNAVVGRGFLSSHPAVESLDIPVLA